MMATKFNATMDGLLSPAKTLYISKCSKRRILQRSSSTLGRKNVSPILIHINNLNSFNHFSTTNVSVLNKILNKRHQHDNSTTRTCSSTHHEQQQIPNDLLVRPVDDHILSLTFNRPKQANAIGRTMLDQLQSAITYLEQDQSPIHNLENIHNITNNNHDGSSSSSSKDDQNEIGNSPVHSHDIRCVLLQATSSSSSKVFSAGADLRERATMTMEEASHFVTSLRDVFHRISNLPMPVIACVEGAAMGGGIEIALTADMIISDKNAKFALPETSLAIIPGAGGTIRLPRLIGLARAKELIFTGRTINAEMSLEYGISQYVVDVGKTEEKALEIAREIVKNGPLAIRAAKKSINKGMQVSSLSEAMSIEKEQYQSIIPTKDRLEGLAAFREKRKPVYFGH